MLDSIIDSLRSLVKPSGKGKEHTAAQLTEALTKGRAEREAGERNLAELRGTMGGLLLEGTPEAIRARESEIADAELALKRLDAVLAELEKGRQRAEEREASAVVDAAITTAVKILKDGKRAMSDYDAAARTAASALKRLKELEGEFGDARHVVEKAGREADLAAAADGHGSPVYGPGFVAGLGNIQDEGKVELPSLGYRPHWGSHFGQAPAEPIVEVEPDPMEMVRRYYPDAGGVWRMGQDGKYRCTRYQMTREEFIERAEALEAGHEMASLAAAH